MYLGREMHRAELQLHCDTSRAHTRLLPKPLQPAAQTWRAVTNRGCPGKKFVRAPFLYHYNAPGSVAVCRVNIKCKREELQSWVAATYLSDTRYPTRS